MTEKIGILGLGRMGGTAARLLLANGQKVFAVDRPSTRWLLDAGGKLVVSPKVLGETANILLVLLAREEDVEQAIFGSQGLAEAKNKGLIVADMGTFGVALKERIYNALMPSGVLVLDAPISGTPDAMETKRAVIMASGDENACEMIRPVLEVLASKYS